MEGGESFKKELVPAERSERINRQKKALVGYDLTGPLECSHSSYDLVLETAEKGAYSIFNRISLELVVPR